MESLTISPPPNSAPYSQDNTDSSTSLEEFFHKEMGSISRSEAKCSICDVSVNIDNPSLELHSGFINAVRAIDLAVTDSDKRETMEDFIKKFGTHYSRKTVMGIGTEFETRYSYVMSLLALMVTLTIIKS